jgi:hypothetical protein
VKNVGTARAGSSRTGFLLSRDTSRSSTDVVLSGRSSVPRLSPGASATATTTVTVPAGTAKGYYYVLGCADVTRVVAESNESDNCRASTAVLTRVLVRPKPPAPDPLTMAMTFRTASAKSVAMRPGTAGSLSVKTPDGTTYSLSVPSHALPAPTTITLTPIASVDPAVLSGGLVAGARLEPSGLQLLQPAILTITPADPSRLTTPAGQHDLTLAFDKSGSNVHGYPDNSELPGLTAPAGSIRFRVEHFSGELEARGTSAQVASVEGHLPVGPDATLESQMNDLAGQVRAGEITEAQFGTKLGDLLVENFVAGVLPAINKALSSTGTRADGDKAWAAYTHWGHWMMVMGFEGGTNTRYRIGYDQLNAAGQDAMVQILRKFFDKDHDDCLSGAEPAMAMYSGMLRIASVAARLGSVESILGADYQDRLDECGAKVKHTWSGTLHYSSTVTQDCTDPCTHYLTEVRAKLVVGFVEELPGNQHWLVDGGSYDVSTHEHSETTYATACTHVEDSRQAASGPMSQADSYYLSQYDNNPKAYTQFAVTTTSDEAITQTRSDCSEDSFTLSDRYYRVGPLQGCPAGATNLEGVPRTTGGQRTLDFTCAVDTTSGGVHTVIDETGTLTRSP